VINENWLEQLNISRDYIAKDATSKFINETLSQAR
jgi:hypothetical protein